MVTIDRESALHGAGAHSQHSAVRGVFHELSVLTLKVALELVGVLTDVVKPPRPLAKFPGKAGILSKPAGHLSDVS